MLKPEAKKTLRMVMTVAPATLPATWRASLTDLVALAEIIGCVELLVEEPKGAARRALRAQLIAWLEAPAGARAASPFCRREWEKVFTVKTRQKAYALARELA